MGTSFSNSQKKCLPLPLLLLLLLVQICLEHVIAASIDSLPGFQGILPFQLETGYVGVGEEDDVQVFYYFVQSETNPKEDPLMLWITGGPGCSPLTALFYEIGPMMFKLEEYNGSLPTIVPNPYSWTKMASIIFVDLPLGTGFTYTKSTRASHYSDLEFSNHAYEFMRKWLSDHPEFSSNQFYLGGDSYAGIPIPMIAQFISNDNEAGLNKLINLKGYVLGNPVTFGEEDNYKVPFSHAMGLIPELFESLKMSCGGEYRGNHVDPNNLPCLENLKAYDELMDGIHPDQILETECGADFLNSFRRTLDERMKELNNLHLVAAYNAKQYAFPCRNEEYILLKNWANDRSVRDALHIQKGSITTWKRCNEVTLRTTNFDIRSYHLNLGKKGLRSLIYSGDHDMVIPHQSTQAWIRDLNYSIIDQWRSWRLINHQVAGYTRTYSNNMTFATIKGGGHTAPENRPEECFTMFKRWISYKAL